MKKIKTFFSIALLLGILTLANTPVKAHCEIPCGIFGDSMRIAMIYEDIETIEKSMNEINNLSTAGNENYNQRRKKKFSTQHTSLQ